MLEKSLAWSLTVMVSMGMSKNTPIGEKLRSWRKLHGLSTKAAGALIEVSGVQWYRYETGDRSVPMERLVPISKVTGLPISQLAPELAKEFAGVAR